MLVCEVWLARDFLARVGRPIDIPDCRHPSESCPPITEETAMSEPIADGPRFNPEALYLALDRQRRARRTSWRGIATEAGVGVFTGPRLGRGQDVHADTFLRLMAWLGETDVTPYMTRDPQS